VLHHPVQTGRKAERLPTQRGQGDIPAAHGFDISPASGKKGLGLPQDAPDNSVQSAAVHTKLKTGFSKIIWQ